jgi:hypothetical protein
MSEPFHLLQEFLLHDNPLVVQQVDQGFRLNNLGHEEFFEGYQALLTMSYPT